MGILSNVLVPGAWCVSHAASWQQHGEHIRRVAVDGEECAASGAGSAGEDEVVEIFEELRIPLTRYLLSLRVPLATAEEIVQETFLKLFLHLREGKSRSNLRGWVFRVAHNMALRNMKQAHRETTDKPVLFDCEPVDPLPNPETFATLKQRHDLLLNAIAQLGEQDQRCLHLRAEGLRYREIGEVLGMKVTTVWDSLTRSMALLRKVMDV